ncbi:PGF-CTERM sorting domain-containing protein [Natronomonas salina]|uniref:PGF-CTERM sorting domain-containing protein n=1 Tax=Natronomonas salina TaxID=1710540 RepID=UPI0015B737C4|nr:PGF-CTERM sorting domain-containing protein [Natronomonas salina]QLD89521.1 PGF-CTERM sorting domain-containing protein [Natronomonas salina]
MGRREIDAVVLATLVTLSAVAGVAALSAVASPVAADQHTVDTATDYTDEANFTVAFPFTTNHYPGDRNAENGSIQYSAVGEQAMREVDAEEGAFISHIVISADWIDYSACSTDNTAAFGIDRGDDDPGTEYDEDLVSRMKEPTFRDDGLTVEFYNWDDIGGDPPYAAADDAIVAEQGARSSGGACLTLTDDPGWYQVQGFINGTEADNGPDQQPSEDANHAGILAMSNYLYVCECDSEAEAREQLGAPPNEEPTGGETPTPTATESGEDPTPTATEGGDTGADPTPTATQSGGSGATTTPTATQGGDGPTPTPGGTAGGQGDDSTTPTPGDGPGFGALAALLALLAGSLLVHRRG